MEMSRSDWKQPIPFQEKLNLNFLGLWFSNMPHRSARFRRLEQAQATIRLGDPKVVWDVGVGSRLGSGTCDLRGHLSSAIRSFVLTLPPLESFFLPTNAFPIQTVPVVLCTFGGRLPNFQATCRLLQPRFLVVFFLAREEGERGEERRRPPCQQNVRNRG